MRARKYTKLIEVWQTTKVQGTYGGNTTVAQLITKSWCNLITKKNIYRDTDFGITETSNQVTIQLRKRNDIIYNSKNQFFKYKGEVYNIISEPVNVGFENREIEITLQKDNSAIVPEIEPIGNQNQNQNQNHNGNG